MFGLGKLFDFGIQETIEREVGEWTAPVEDAIQDTVEAIGRNSGISGIFRNIGSAIRNATGGLVDMVKGWVDGLGESIASSSFISNHELPTDVVHTGLEIPDINAALSAAGLTVTPDLNSAISEAADNARQGWGRTSQVMVDKTRNLLGSIGSGIGNIFNQLFGIGSANASEGESAETTTRTADAATLERARLNMAAEIYDSVYRSILIDMGFTEQEIDGEHPSSDIRGTPLALGDHYTQLAERLGSDHKRLARQIAESVSGVQKNGRNVAAIRDNDGNYTGMLGQMHNGGQVEVFTLASHRLPEDVEAQMTAARAHVDTLQAERDAQMTVREEVLEIQREQPDFFEALTPLQREQLIRARVDGFTNGDQEAPDERRVTSEEIDRLLRSDLSALVGRLGKQGSPLGAILSMADLDIDIEGDEIVFSGMAPNQANPTEYRATLPPMPRGANSPEPAPSP